MKPLAGIEGINASLRYSRARILAGRSQTDENVNVVLDADEVESTEDNGDKIVAKTVEIHKVKQPQSVNNTFES